MLQGSTHFRINSLSISHQFAQSKGYMVEVGRWNEQNDHICCSLQLGAQIRTLLLHGNILAYCALKCIVTMPFGLKRLGQSVKAER